MKKIHYALIYLTAIATTVYAGIKTTGAPPAHTNAPEENTCAQQGCHADNILNSGTGSINVQMDSAIDKYNPNQTYTISLKVKQGSLKRFGFQAVALFDADSTNAGEISLTDANRMQLMDGANQYSGRNYITYTEAGTSATKTGEGEWSFKWKAPAKTKGAVTFYLAGVAADDDQTDKGDYTYTTKLSLAENTNVGIEDFSKEIGLKITPPYFNKQLLISYNAPLVLVTELRNLQGQIMPIYLESNAAANRITTKIQLENNIGSGIYILCLKEANHTITRKIFIP
ncbi:MAG: T9SS type A sorting domain-containing protein [Bacteroidetes bacterium]|nr:T9SS type A sorting domain-containing protein [Bacteroidota bacterium]